VSETQEKTDDKNVNAQRSRVAQWSSLFAFAISALALALSVYQTQLMQSQARLMQTQARASVWPHVDIGYNYSDRGDNAGFDLHVQNTGVGPAIAQSVRVSLDGKPIHHWGDFFAEVVGKGKTAQADLVGLSNAVIPPNSNRDTVLPAMRITDKDIAKKIYEARSRLDVQICYCSIYDDCWIATFKTPRPTPMPACHESEDEFDY
jgi:hypothetical protein